MTLNGYEKTKRNAAAPAPLTLAEEELAQVKKTETNAHISIDTKHQTLTGVAFPVTEEGIKAILDFRQKKHSYVQLSIGKSKNVIMKTSSVVIMLLFFLFFFNRHGERNSQFRNYRTDRRS